jgi:DNA-binding transcriptional LysR family regulator
MNQLQAMRVFTRVVDLTSFGQAAKQLGMSAAAVTRSVSMLEAHLNMRLLNRSSRRLSLTEAGQAYVDGCRTIIEQLDAIEENLVRSTRELSGTLRIAASTTYATCGLSNLLAAYRAAYPRIGFDVTTYDSPIELIEGGFDVGFSADRTLPNSALVCRHLTAFKEVAVASPGYLSLHGTPVNPSALANHHLLSTSDGAARTWEFSDQHGAYRVATGNALHATSSATIRSAALADMGIAMLPAPLVKDDLAKGHLLPILSQFQISGGMRQVSILYTGRNYLTAKVRHFIDFSVSQYRAPEQMVSLRAAA